MNKVQLLRNLMKEKGIDAYLIPNNDEFQNEYLPVSAKRLELITGFTGSAGTAIIAQEKAVFFTDGRYTLQAAQEVDSDIFEIFNIADKKPEDWLKDNNLTVTYDPNLLTATQSKKYNGEILQGNLVDKIWQDKPASPCEEVAIFPLKYAGKSHKEKIAEIAKAIEADIALITAPDSVNWLFNIRGADIPYTPLCLCYAAIHKNGKADIFIDSAKLTDEVKEHLSDVNILSLDEIKNIKAKAIQLDESNCPMSIYSAYKDTKLINKPDPCQLPKAIKNQAEITAIKNAHDIDGKALTKFLSWLPYQIATDELSAALRLAEYRRENPEYVGPSFTTISGFGSNGAIVHYSASEKTNKKFESNNLYLVDSGGQYFGNSTCGTTDVTRTIAIGTPTDEMKHNYTLVLKGHIAIATAEFDETTTGKDLDDLARQFLREEDKDYDHGTGHGVGCYLSVHEGPCGISKRYTDRTFKPGMLISNEPGYYKTGEYGIRIENLVLVVEKQNGKLSFDTLTKAPLDENLIEWEILTDKEKDWINSYHEQVSRNI